MTALDRNKDFLGQRARGLARKEPMMKASRLVSVLALALCIVGMFAGSAFAQTASEIAVVNAAVDQAATTSRSILTTNLPVILGVLGVSLLLSFGIAMVLKVKRVFAK